MSGPEDKDLHPDTEVPTNPLPGLLGSVTEGMTEDEIYKRLDQMFPEKPAGQGFTGTEYQKTAIPTMPPPHPGFDPLMLDQPGYGLWPVRAKEKLVGLKRKAPPPPAPSELPPWPKKGIVVLDKEGNPTYDKNGKQVRMFAPKGVKTTKKKGPEQYILDAQLINPSAKHGAFARWVIGQSDPLGRRRLFPGAGKTHEQVGTQEYGGTADLLQINIGSVSDDVVSQLDAMGIQVVGTGIEMYEELPVSEHLSTKASREAVGQARKSEILASDKKTARPTGGVVKRLSDKARKLYQLAEKGQFDALIEAQVLEAQIRNIPNNPEYRDAFWTLQEEAYLKTVGKYSGKDRDSFTAGFFKRYPESFDRIFPMARMPDGTERRLDEPVEESFRFSKFEWGNRSSYAIATGRQVRGPEGWTNIRIPIHPHDARDWDSFLMETPTGKDRLTSVTFGKTLGGPPSDLPLPFEKIVSPKRGVSIGRALELYNAWEPIERELTQKYVSKSNIPAKEAWERFSALHIEEDVDEGKPFDYVEKMENFQEFLMSAPDFIGGLDPDMTKAAVNAVLAAHTSGMMPPSVRKKLVGDYVDKKFRTPEEETGQRITDKEMFLKEHERAPFDDEELNAWIGKVRNIRHLVDNATSHEETFAYFMGWLYGGWGKHVVPAAWSKMGAFWHPDSQKWVDPRSLRKGSGRKWYQLDWKSIQIGVDNMPDEMWHLILAFPVIGESIAELTMEPFSGRTMKESAELWGPKISGVVKMIGESGGTALTNPRKTMREEGLLSLTLWGTGGAQMARWAVKSVAKAKLFQSMKKRLTKGELHVPMRQASPELAAAVEGELGAAAWSAGEAKAAVQVLERHPLLTLTPEGITKLNPKQVRLRNEKLKELQTAKDTAAGFEMDYQYGLKMRSSFDDMVLNPELSKFRYVLGWTAEQVPSLAGWAAQEMALLGSGIPTALLAFDVPRVMLNTLGRSRHTLRWYMMAPSERLPIVYMGNVYESQWAIRMQELAFKGDLQAIDKSIHPTVRRVFHGQHDDVIITADMVQGKFQEYLGHGPLRTAPASMGYGNLSPQEVLALEAFHERFAEIGGGLRKGEKFQGPPSIPALVWDDAAVLIERDAVLRIRRQAHPSLPGFKGTDPLHGGDVIAAKLDPKGGFRVVNADGSLGELVGKNYKFAEIEADIAQRGAWVVDQRIAPLLKPEHVSRIRALQDHMNTKGVLSLSRRSLKVQSELRGFRWTDKDGNARTGLFADPDAVRKFYWPQMYRREQTIEQGLKRIINSKAGKARDKEISKLLKDMAEDQKGEYLHEGVNSNRWMNRQLDRIGVDFKIREQVLGLQDNLPLEVFGGIGEAKFVLETHKLYKRMSADPRMVWQGKEKPSAKHAKNWMLLDDAAIKKFGRDLGMAAGATGRGVPVYGMIQGKYVNKAIWTELMYMQKIGQQLRGNLFAKFITVHKGMVTFMNPATTFRNLYTNLFVLGPMAGMNLINPANWGFAKKALVHMETSHLKSHASFNEAYASGVFQGNWARLEAGSMERKAVVMSMRGMFGTGLDQVLTPVRGLRNLIHNKNLKGFTAGMKKFIWENPGVLYGAMDDYFRYATWLKYRQMGMSAREASTAVQKAYVNYGDVAGLVQYLRAPVAKGALGKLAWAVGGVEFGQFVHGSLKALADYARKSPFKAQVIMNYTDYMSQQWQAAKFAMDPEEGVEAAKWMSRNMPGKGRFKYHPVDRSPVLAKFAKWVTGEETEVSGAKQTLGAIMAVKSAHYNILGPLINHNDAMNEEGWFPELVRSLSGAKNPARTVIEGTLSFLLADEQKKGAWFRDKRGTHPFSGRPVLSYKWTDTDKIMENTADYMHFLYSSAGWPLLPPGLPGEKLLTAYRERDAVKAERNVTKLENQLGKALKQYGVESVEGLERRISDSYAEASDMRFTQEEADKLTQEDRASLESVAGINMRLSEARGLRDELGRPTGGRTRQVMTMRHAITETIFGWKFKKVEVPPTVGYQIMRYSQNNKRIKGSVDTIMKSMFPFFKAYGEVNFEAFHKLGARDEEEHETALREYLRLMVLGGLNEFERFRHTFKGMPGLPAGWRDRDLQIGWKMYPTHEGIERLNVASRIDVQAWKDIMSVADLRPLMSRAQADDVEIQELLKMYAYIWGDFKPSLKADARKEKQLGFIPAILRLNRKWREVRALEKKGRAMEPEPERFEYLQRQQ